MARRKPPFRTGTALPNASEHEKAEGRRESAKAFVRPSEDAAKSGAPAGNVPPDAPGIRNSAPGSRAESREGKKPAATPGENPDDFPHGTGGRKRNIRGAAVWLAEDMSRFENLAAATGTSVAYVQKAAVRQAAARLRGLDKARAQRLGTDLQQHLQLRRRDGDGATEVNGYLSGEILGALRNGLNDPFGVVSDYRVVSTAFRQLALEALGELEKTTSRRS